MAGGDRRHGRCRRRQRPQPRHSSQLWNREPPRQPFHHASHHGLPVAVQLVVVVPQMVAVDAAAVAAAAAAGHAAHHRPDSPSAPLGSSSHHPHVDHRLHHHRVRHRAAEAVPQVQAWPSDVHQGLARRPAAAGHGEQREEAQEPDAGPAPSCRRPRRQPSWRGQHDLRRTPVRLRWAVYPCATSRPSALPSMTDWYRTACRSRGRASWQNRIGRKATHGRVP